MELLGAGERPQGGRHIGQVAQLEAHIAGMAGGGGPYVRVAQRVDDGSVPAGALAEHAAPSLASASELALDVGQHFGNQEIFPRTRRRRVDVLIAADARETIGKCDDHRRHALLADQPVKTFRHVLPEGHPIGLGEAAAGYTDQVDKEGQPASVMPGRDIDIDGGAAGSPKMFPFSTSLSTVTRLTEPLGPGIYHSSSSLNERVIRNEIITLDTTFYKAHRGNLSGTPSAHRSGVPDIAGDTDLRQTLLAVKRPATQGQQNGTGS